MLQINALAASSSSITTVSLDTADNPSRSTSFSHRLTGVHNQPIDFHVDESPRPSVAQHERASVCQAYFPQQFPCNNEREKKILINEIIRENALDDVEKEQSLRNRVNNLNFAELFNVAKGKDFRKFTHIIGIGLWDRVRTSSKLKLGNNLLLFASGAFWTASAMLPANDYPQASNILTLWLAASPLVAAC